MKAITDKITKYLDTWFAGKTLVADILTAINEAKADKEELQKVSTDFQKIVSEIQKPEVTIDDIKTIIEGSKGTDKAISVENFTGNETEVNPAHFYMGEKDKPKIPMEIHPEVLKRIADLEAFREELKDKI